ncbi:DUF6378 domain-containing protein [Iodobacter sp.]|uniref:DUF6378 domain-containing protein n=1 Tax=Iodobacter sp. TaxID=1915058 RepID=UPI0025F54976|nr:DUF6378 domain-containing protein [Iodobacter sp.]
MNKFKSGDYLVCVYSYGDLPVGAVVKVHNPFDNEICFCDRYGVFCWVNVDRFVEFDIEKAIRQEKYANLFFELVVDHGELKAGFIIKGKQSAISSALMAFTNQCGQTQRVNKDKLKPFTIPKEPKENSMKQRTKPEKLLNSASEVFKQRGDVRDQEDGERSMERIVNMFNAMKGDEVLTEKDGWLFMALLKIARAEVKPQEDDFVDGINYLALAGEACL